ncbi:MAG: polyprenyl synthetase family protein [Planctomycetes bacterium]|nr:polyprenyl synthetase family protein [Planctomycetota bacterium]
MVSDTPTDLTRLVAPIAVEFAAVDRRLREELRSQEPFIGDLLAEVAALGGKRLRTVVLLLAARASGPVSASHVDAAVAVEMVHTASLLHDDVIDAATMRRGRPTLNSRHHPSVPVLLGDHLFSRAFSLIARLPRRDAAVWLSDAASLLCQGEVLQNHYRARWDLTEAQYFDIISKKTALLFAEAARLGPALAGAAEPCALAFRRFGMGFGDAFQIIDDCLDLVGDEAAVGKTLGTDLAGGKATLPIILLLARLDGPDRDFVRSLLAGEAADPTGGGRLRDLLLRHGVIEAARDHARRRLDEAYGALEPLGDFPTRANFLMLRDLALGRDR